MSAMCQLRECVCLSDRAYQTNSDERRTGIPSNKRELVREPVKRQVVPGRVSKAIVELFLTTTHHVQVRCSTGVGSRSLLDHLASPIVA
jgi:hypothetical protein